MGLLEITVKSEPMDEEISAKENEKTRNFLVKNWMLGPVSVKEPGDYWRKLSIVWRTSPDQAKRNLCANCEYFEDTPEMLAKMESVPEDQFDKDGGGRGWCHKFDFICHNLRVCKAWEKADQQPEEGEDYGNDESEDA